MGDISAALQDLSIRDRVTEAVKKFREKQIWSNQQWLEARVERAEMAEEGAIYDEKAVLAECLGYDDWASCASSLGVTSPIEILTRSLDVGQHDSGTLPPVPAKELHAFLDRLQAGVNDPFDKDDPGYAAIHLPPDYISLLAVTDGIFHIDLRRSGVCGIEGVNSSDPANMTHTHLGESAVDEDGCLLLPLGQGMWRDGWELGAGFPLGQGQPENRSFMVYYYCSRSEQTSRGPKIEGDEIKDDQREWKWRIFFAQEVSPRLRCTEAERERVFDGVVEWLEWYGDWWARESEEMAEYPDWYTEKVLNAEAMYGDALAGDTEDEDDDDDGYGGCACGMCYHGAETCTSALK